LNALTLKRREDKAHYKASVRDHAAMIGALDQVVASLTRLRGSISGIGKPAHVGAIAQERRDAAWKASMKSKFVEIVGEDEAAAFAELATEADQGALEKLIALLNRIQRSVKQSLADDEAHEKKSRAIYRRLKTALENDNRVLVKALEHQRANLNAYLKKINELTVTIKLKRQLLAVAEKQLASKREELRRTEAAYKRDKKKRNSEKKIIRKLQKIVNERLAKMSQFLRSAVNK
jgi:hypothetical protein